MSVLIETSNGEYVLYCKGADNIMFDRINSKGRIVDATSSHLNEYATDGLRTLVFAKRSLSVSEFKSWLGLWRSALNATEGRNEEMAKVAAFVEKDLELVGATAIEDALQDEVPGVIRDLLSCGIKLWVLTGDKMETAINIGYSCKLLQEEMTLIKVQAIDGNPHSVKLQLQRLVKHFGQATKVQSVRQRLRKGMKKLAGLNIFDIEGGRGLEVESQSRSQANEINNSAGQVDGSDGDNTETTMLSEGVVLSQLESQDLALIIDGPSLAYVFGDKDCEKMLLQVSAHYGSIIFVQSSELIQAMALLLPHSCHHLTLLSFTFLPSIFFNTIVISDSVHLQGSNCL